MLLLSLLTATASAQPVLAPDSVRALAQRAAQSGLLADSTATEITRCAAEGIPVTRSAIVDAVVRHHVGEWSFLTDVMSPPGPSDMADEPAAFMSAWVDRLAAAGLVTPDDVRATAALLAEATEAVPAIDAPASQAALLRAVGALLAQRLALNPAWLAEDAEQWVREGMLTDAGRTRLLADARAGRLWAPHEVLPYLDATERTGVEPTRASSGVPSLDTLATLMDAGVRLLRRRGVVDLQVEGLAVNSGRRGSVRAPPVLTAQVDGVEYSQQAWSVYAPLTLLNRVLRDRRSPYRLHTSPLLSPDRQRTEIAVLALTPAGRALLQPREAGDFSPPRRSVLEALGQANPDASCRGLAFQALRAVYLEIEVAGPSATSYEEALSSDGVARVLDQLAAARTFDHLSAERRAEVRDALSERYLTGPRDVLEAMPERITTFAGDDGTYGGGQPYADEIRRFAQASHGAFRPTGLVDTFSSGADSARVAFVADGRAFETTVAVGGWLSSSFVDLIAAAVEGSGVRLYRLGSFTEDGFAFLTPEAWAALATLGSFGDGAGPVVEVGSSG